MGDIIAVKDPLVFDTASELDMTLLFRLACRSFNGFSITVT